MTDLIASMAASASGMAAQSARMRLVGENIANADPSHPMADTSGYYDGSNVNLVLEIADAREAQRGYEANLRLFDQARQMSSAALTLLRR